MEITRGLREIKMMNIVGTFSRMLKEPASCLWSYEELALDSERMAVLVNGASIEYRKWLLRQF
jgi:hypothetical protein